MWRPLGASLMAAILAQASATAADFKDVGARGKQVRIITTAGKRIVVNEKYPVRQVRMAPNGMVAAWLLLDVTFEEPAGTSGSATLVVYRKGKRRTLPCFQLIRQYWFREQGQQIAYDCGGMHFAGNEVLFDTRTLKEIAHFHQGDVDLDKRPAWSSDKGAGTGN